jgi:PAS domain S-box-containing protein
VNPTSDDASSRAGDDVSASTQTLLDEITGSAAWLRLVWESAPDAMALSDADGIVLMVNRAYCELYGFERDEVVGQTFALIFPPELRDWAIEQYRAVFASASPTSSYETWIQRKDGTERFVQSRAEVIAEQGRPRALLSIIRDITERKQAEEALREREERLQVALTLAPVMVFTQDMELRYTWAQSSILGVPGAEEIVGKTDADLLPAHEAESLRALKRRVLEDGEHIQSEIRLTTGGTGFDVNFVCAPLRDSKGTITGLIAAAVNVSDYRTLERQQREFIAVAAHELRTPVTSILAFAQLLQRSDPRNKPLGSIIRQAVNLTRLIGDLADVSRLDTGQLVLRRETLDLVAVVRDVAEQFQPLSEAHPIQVEATAESLIGTWDRDRLEQVIQNLLTNAIKYSPNGGEIRVVIEDLGADARLAVRDEGIGIPPGLLTRVFEPFYRVEPATRAIRGLGLGLHISKALVEAHGGRIQAVSAGEGQGSTFTVTLPRHAAE